MQFNRVKFYGLKKQHTERNTLRIRLFTWGTYSTGSFNRDDSGSYQDRNCDIPFSILTGLNSNDICGTHKENKT